MVKNSFWKYSLKVYDHPVVAEQLLHLQDSYALDVNIMLCCGWLGVQGFVLSECQMSTLVDTSEFCRENCVGPLRRARRFLKQQENAEQLYQHLKRVELEAESWQQDAMWHYLSSLQLHASEGAIEHLVLRNLRTYANRLSHLQWEQLAKQCLTLSEQMVLVKKR